MLNRLRSRIRNLGPYEIATLCFVFALRFI